MTNRQPNFFDLSDVRMQCTSCRSWFTCMADAAHHTLACSTNLQQSSKASDKNSSKQHKSFTGRNLNLSGSHSQNIKSQVFGSVPENENSKQPENFPRSSSILSHEETSKPKEDLQCSCTAEQIENFGAQRATESVDFHPADAPASGSKLSPNNYTSIMGQKTNDVREENTLPTEQNSFMSNGSGSPSKKRSEVNTSNLSVQVTSGEDIHEQAIQCWDCYEENSLPSVVISLSEANQKPPTDSTKCKATGRLLSTTDTTNYFPSGENQRQEKGNSYKNLVKVKPTFRTASNFSVEHSEVVEETFPLDQDSGAGVSAVDHQNISPAASSTAYDELLDPMVSIDLEICDSKKQCPVRERNADKRPLLAQRGEPTKRLRNSLELIGTVSRTQPRRTKEARSSGILSKRLCRPCERTNDLTTGYVVQNDLTTGYVVQNNEIGMRVESKLNELIDINRRREALELRLCQQSNESLLRLKHIENIFAELLDTTHVNATV